MLRTNLSVFGQCLGVTHGQNWNKIDCDLMSYMVTGNDGDRRGNGEEGRKRILKSHVWGFECTWPATKILDLWHSRLPRALRSSNISST